MQALKARYATSLTSRRRASSSTTSRRCCATRRDSSSPIDAHRRAPTTNAGIALVVGIESRGFILGAAVADRLGAGFVPVRKVGKLPSTTMRVTLRPRIRDRQPRDAQRRDRAGQRVLIVDDLLATGGTARATVDLVKAVGGNVAGVAFLIELRSNGRASSGRDVSVSSGRGGSGRRTRRAVLQNGTGRLARAADRMNVSPRP